MRKGDTSRLQRAMRLHNMGHAHGSHIPDVTHVEPTGQART